MVATLQRLDARSFYFRSELSVCSLLALFLKIFRDRVSCHSLQCGRTISDQAVQFWPLRDNSMGTRGMGGAESPVKTFLGLASRASHEPHDHQNHNNCSDQTHT
jgi:hypothetical protein